VQAKKERKKSSPERGSLCKGNEVGFFSHRWGQNPKECALTNWRIKERFDHRPTEKKKARGKEGRGERKKDFRVKK